MSTKREQILAIYREMAAQEPIETRQKDFRNRFIQSIQDRVEGLNEAASGTLGMYFAWAKRETENGGQVRKYHSEKRVRGKAKEDQEIEDARAAFLAPPVPATGWKRVEEVLHA